MHPSFRTPNHQLYPWPRSRPPTLVLLDLLNLLRILHASMSIRPTLWGLFTHSLASELLPGTNLIYHLEVAIPMLPRASS